jgi:hypothetical protein
MREWQEYFWRARESMKRTWTLHLATLVVIGLIGALTRDFWVSQIGRSLMCVDDLAPSEMILIENFDPNYLLFERAAALEMIGLAPTALVPVEPSRDPEVANAVSRGIAELMARQARLRDWEIMLLREVEPITLNAAAQIRERLTRQRVKSVIVVSSGFRSRRSSLVFRAVLGDAGIQVHCVPVFGRKTVEHWADTWHGMQEVFIEFLKLQYYRFYVLPFASRTYGH